MRWIRWYHPFYQKTTGHSTTAKNIPIFRISKLQNSTYDSPPLQSDNHWGWRTWPIECAESARAIHFVITPLVVVLQPRISLFSKFQNSAPTQNPPMTGHYCSQITLENGVLDLFDALDLLVPSILSSDLCWWYWSQEYSHFQNFKPLHIHKTHLP